jgi:hypothetical protein
MVMTAPWIFLPRKSSADLTRDLIKMVVTSWTVRVRSAGVGSERGVGAWDAAGVLKVDAVVMEFRGDGEAWRIWTL